MTAARHGSTPVLSPLLFVIDANVYLGDMGQQAESVIWGHVA